MQDKLCFNLMSTCSMINLNLVDVAHNTGVSFITLLSIEWMGWGRPIMAMTFPLTKTKQYTKRTTTTHIGRKKIHIQPKL